MSWKGNLIKLFVGLPIMLLGQMFLIPAVFSSATKYFDFGLTNVGGFFFGIILLFFGLGIIMFSDDLVGIIKIERRKELSQK